MPTMYIYSWKDDKMQSEITSIRIYGIGENNETICLRVDDFAPYVYLELPRHMEWSSSKIQLLGNKLDELLKDKKPLKKTLVYKKPLYYANKNPDATYPYLFCTFSSRIDIKTLFFKLKKPLNILGLGFIQLKMHEDNAPNELQITCFLDIPVTGWIQFTGTPVHPEDKLTYADEYTVSWKNIKPYASDKIVRPLKMSYDIEVNSTDPNKMPNAEKFGDAIFQISCIFGRDDNTDKILISLFNPDHATIGDDVELILCENEADLLQAFVDLIIEKQPNIIIGYNIFTFDIPYMIDRAKLHMVINEFDRQGFDMYGHAEEKTIDWSSSAFKNQHFQYLDAEGRLFIDLLPLIKRDYKFNTYTLKFVSDHFLGDTKDPINHKQIFAYYMKAKNGAPDAPEKLGLIGKYCVQDSMLVYRLFDKLQHWFSLTEMSMVTNVPIFKLYTQGQQLKVFSQVYKKCMKEGVVVEKDVYNAGDDEHYQGAFVIDPVPGIYDKVVPFDFASLYPSIMISHNVCYSTFVPDGVDIPDSKCHIFDWEEHKGCMHDTKKRKGKVLNVLCGHRHFRFLKEPKGIMPSLLEDLITARKTARVKKEELEKRLPLSDNKHELEQMIGVLECRQISYKLSSNSAYGAMGVRRGYLPLMPGAMCVTAKGRESIERVMQIITEQYRGEIVYGDTDSNYVRFPHLETPEELWAYGKKVSSEVSALFPKPMKLEFEKFIYWRFLILTAKCYMSLKYYEGEGLVDKIEKKGVLLSRRDKSNFVKIVYENIVMRIFKNEPQEVIFNACIDYATNLLSYTYPSKDFIITKSVGNIGDMSVSLILGNKKKVRMGDYTVDFLPKSGPDRENKLRLKNAVDEKEFYMRCLPAQVQLSQKIRDRGGRVDVGTRLEYVIVTHPFGEKAKQYEKIESYDYYKDHVGSIVIDFNYYLKALAKPIDQLLSAVFKTDKFMTNQYKRVLVKKKVVKEIIDLSKPKIIFL